MTTDMKITRLYKSVSDAWRGIRRVYHEEQNFRVQIFLALAAALLGFVFRLTRTEWIALIFAMLVVLLLELLNSAAEQFLDVLRPRLQSQVKLMKDMMAGAVLLAACGALLIGMLIFVPHIITYAISAAGKT